MQVATAALKAFTSNTKEAQISHALSQPTKDVAPQLQQWDDDWEQDEDDLDYYDEEAQTDEDRTQEYLDMLSDEILFSKAIWSGIYSGLYSVSKKGMVPKPTSECLGDWIVNDINSLREFRTSMLTDYFGVSLDEYKNAWYATGDLMFKNFDACHFKAVMEDVNAYCGTKIDKKSGDLVVPDKYKTAADEEESSNDDNLVGVCSGGRILSNVQSNVFALVTQGSALAATFQQEGWADQDAEDKAYSYQQLGHTLGQFYVDLTGFKPTLLKY